MTLSPDYEHEEYRNGSLYADFNGTGLHGNDTDGAHGGMPTYAQAVVIVMYVTITVLAVGGNAIVVYIVMAYQRMRTVTNYFIVNLSLSDIIMSVVCIPFTFISNMLVQYWPFGAVMCPIVSYAQAIAVFLSAFTLVAISLDRYVAIIYPLRPRMTSKQAAVIICCIWCLSLAVPLPVAILSKIKVIGGKDNCVEIWPSMEQRYVYSIVVMVVQYFLPLFVLMFTYTRIAIIIWVKRTPGVADNTRDQRMAASKRKMVKMMITVVIIYALCWLPLHTVTLIGDTHEELWTFRYIQVVWIACHWLAMSNSCYNPMVYCWMNSKYRNGFRYVLRKCPCVTYKEEEHGPYQVKRVNTYISTVRTSIRDRKITTTITPSPSPTRAAGQPTFGSAGAHHHESIPLNNLSNGLSKSNNRWKAGGPGGRHHHHHHRGADDHMYGHQHASSGEHEPLTLSDDDNV